MNATTFAERFGTAQLDDDLERVNCDRVGTIGHQQCGLCPTHNRPRFSCGCLATKDPMTPANDTTIAFEAPPCVSSASHAERVAFRARLSAAFEAKGLGSDVKAAVAELGRRRAAMPNVFDRMAFDNEWLPCGVPLGLVLMAYTDAKQDAPKPLHAFRNEETGMEGRVWAGKADHGRPTFNVTLCDLDSGETHPSSRRGVKLEADAIALAKKWAGVS